MIIKKLCLVVILLCAVVPFGFNAKAEGAYAVRFTDMSFSSEFKVYFTDMSFSADEKWYVSGSCPSSFGGTKIYVTDMSFSADIKVYITDMSFSADKKICIANQDDAPDKFWEAYKD